MLPLRGRSHPTPCCGGLCFSPSPRWPDQACHRRLRRGCRMFPERRRSFPRARDGSGRTARALACCRKFRLRGGHLIRGRIFGGEIPRQELQILASAAHGKFQAKAGEGIMNDQWRCGFAGKVDKPSLFALSFPPSRRDTIIIIGPRYPAGFYLNAASSLRLATTSECGIDAIQDRAPESTRCDFQEVL